MTLIRYITIALGNLQDKDFKREFISLFLLSHLLNVFGQVYTGPIPKPSDGYGSDGIYPVSVQSFENPNFPSEDIKIYYPSGLTSSVPTLFYCHAYGGSNPFHVIGLLNFFARKGYAVVFVPYQTAGLITVNDRYINLLEGFRKSARDFPNIIHGYWSSLVKGGQASNNLTDDRLTDIGGGAALQDCRVEVVKT